MWIKTQNKQRIIRALSLSIQTNIKNNWVLCTWFAGREYILGEYETEKKAQKVFAEIEKKMIDGEKFYQMP